jgi:hypothetical protein
MPDGFDVFLSRNSRDKPEVEKIAQHLRARGLRVFMDKWVCAWKLSTCSSSSRRIGR